MDGVLASPGAQRLRVLPAPSSLTPLGPRPGSLAIDACAALGTSSRGKHACREPRFACLRMGAGTNSWPLRAKYERRGRGRWLCDRGRCCCVGC